MSEWVETPWKCWGQLSPWTLGLFWGSPASRLLQGVGGLLLPWTQVPPPPSTGRVPGKPLLESCP